MIDKVKCLAFALLMVISIASQAEDLTSRSMSNYRFVLRANKAMIGGTVEVYTAEGQRIMVETIAKKRVVVSFASALPGAYTIVVRQQGVVKEYKIRKLATV